jgi:hypothetical protein
VKNVKEVDDQHCAFYYKVCKKVVPHPDAQHLNISPRILKSASHANKYPRLKTDFENKHSA